MLIARCSLLAVTLALMCSVASAAANSQARIKLDDDEVVDVCQREHPCENGGQCFVAPMAPSSYVCQCHEHYHGSNCEEKGIVALPKEYFVLRILFITLTVIIGAVTFATLFYRWRVVGKHQQYRLRSIKDLTDTRKPVVLLPTGSVPESLIYMISHPKASANGSQWITAKASCGSSSKRSSKKISS